MQRIPLAQRLDMPRYQSHKIVGALRIAGVSGTRVSFEPVYSLTGDETLQPEPIDVDPAMFLRYTPTAGDYYVVYEDGYDSFSPKKAFEEGYTPATTGSSAPGAAAKPVTEQELASRAVAPRVAPADIEANIASEHYFTAADGVIGAAAPKASNEDGTLTHAMVEYDKAAAPSLGLLTFCVLVLRNGFTVVGQSACASPENFDAGIGRRIARQDAVRQVWPLMGYELRSKLAQRAELGCSPT